MLEKNRNSVQTLPRKRNSQAYPPEHERMAHGCAESVTNGVSASNKWNLRVGSGLRGEYICIQLRYICHCRIENGVKITFSCWFQRLAIKWYGSSIGTSGEIAL